MASYNVALSKKLAYLLRHGAIKHGVPIRSDGFVKITDLLTCNYLGRKCTLEAIQRVVDRNSKHWFM